MKKTAQRSNRVWSVVMTIVCVLYMYPIFMVLSNSLKVENAISTSTAFELPSADTFAGLDNYVNAISSQGFLSSLFYTTFITVTSVVAILLFCSMFAWYITRVNTRVTKALYLLCAFSMVVPFQMVMFTLSSMADTLKFNTPWTLWIIYLGFGAGLAVFMFCGFMRSVPIDIEESGRIDGANRFQVFTRIVLPLVRPGIVSTAIYVFINAWNEFLYALLLVSSSTKTTLSVAVKTLEGADILNWGSMMAASAIVVLPSIIFFCMIQNKIAGGLADGAVK